MDAFAMSSNEEDEIRKQAEAEISAEEEKRLRLEAKVEARKRQIEENKKIRAEAAANREKEEAEAAKEKAAAENAAETKRLKESALLVKQISYLVKQAGGRLTPGDLSSQMKARSGKAWNSTYGVLHGPIPTFIANHPEAFQMSKKMVTLTAVLKQEKAQAQQEAAQAAAAEQAQKEAEARQQQAAEEAQRQVEEQAAARHEQARLMLMEFYTETDPTKLANVDGILQRFNGNEQQIFDMVDKSREQMRQVQAQKAAAAAQRAAVAPAATMAYTMSMEERTNYAGLFRKYDADGDGFIEVSNRGQCDILVQQERAV
jgi:hypothetical protein